MKRGSSAAMSCRATMESQRVKDEAGGGAGKERTRSETERCDDVLQNLRDGYTGI